MTVDGEKILANERGFHPILQDCGLNSGKGSSGNSSIGVNASDLVAVLLQRIGRAAGRDLHREGLHIRDANTGSLSALDRLRRQTG
jgi:hypothetical protein